MGPKAKAKPQTTFNHEEAAPKQGSKKFGSIAVYASEDKIPILVPSAGKNSPTNWISFKECLSLYCRRHCTYWNDFIESKTRPIIPTPKHPRWANMTAAEIASLGDVLEPPIPEEDENEGDEAVELGIANDEAKEDDGSVYGDEIDQSSSVNFTATTKTAASSMFAKREEEFQRRLFDLKSEGRHIHALIISHASQASLNCIISEKNYLKMSVQKSDPLWVFSKLELTHWLSPSGHTVLDKFIVEDRWNKFVFRDDEDVATCKERWLRLKMQVDALNIPTRSEPEYVQLFICTKLPSSLSEYKKRFIEDSETSSRVHHPTTMEGLFDRLKRELKVEKTSAGRLAVVPVMQSFAAIKDKKKSGKKNKKSDPKEASSTTDSSSNSKETSEATVYATSASDVKESKKKPSRPCTTCELLGKSGDTMHWTSECPHKEEVKRLLKEAQQSKTKIANFASVCPSWYHSEEDIHIDEDLHQLSFVNLELSERAESDEVKIFDISNGEFQRIQEAITLGQQSQLGPYDVVLDGGAQVGIFHNENLLTDVRSAPAIDIKGVTGIERSDRAGSFHGLYPIYILPTSPANLLPQSLLEDERKLIYDMDTFTYTVDNSRADTPEYNWKFIRRNDLGGLRVCNFKNSTALPAYTISAPVITDEQDSDPSAWNSKTVDGRLKALKPRDRKGAITADEFMQRLGYESSKSTANIIRGGTMLNTPCTTKNVYDSVRVHMGELEAGTKGKGRHKNDPVHALEPSDYYVSSDVALEADLFFVDKSVFLLTLSDYGYAMATHLGQAVKNTRLPSVVWDALPKHFSAYVSKGQQVKSFKADGEGCFYVNRQNIEERGITFISGKACRAEERIKWIKNKDRSTKAGLSFPLFGTLIVMCVLAMVRLTNFIPSVGTPGGISPFEIFTGVRPDAKRDIPYSFGDYGLVTPPQSNPPAPYNSAAPRRTSVIYLFPDKVWSLKSRRLLTRVTFSKRAMPPEAIIYMHQLAAADGVYRSRSQPLWRTPTGILSSLPDDDDEEIREEPLIPVHRRLEDTSDFVDLPYLPANTNDEDLLNAGDDNGVDVTNTENLDEISGVPIDDEVTLESTSRLVPTHDDTIEYTVPEERPEFTPSERRYPLRQSRTNWKERFGLHVKVKEALKTHREAGLQAMIKELQSVGVTKRAIIPVHLNSYYKDRHNRIIPSSFFFKEKFSRATGELIKLKGRLVAGGHMQDRELYEEDKVSSPTASTAAVYILASLAAKEEKNVWTCDIGTAYLNAPMPETGPKQLMRLDKEVASVLVWIKPEYAEFQRDDGTMVVEISKALYGCIESAKLWYDELANFLESIDFKKNAYEPCLFTKYLPSGERFDLLIYVDDLLMVCKSTQELDTFVKTLIEKYKEVTVCKESVQEYLGMVLDFSVKHQVQIDMSTYTNSILQDYSIETNAATPAENFLFTQRQDSPLLDRERASQFHSGVMRLMFLAKRVRIDILTAVVYLSSRVQCANEDDWKKFLRVLKYLHGTKNLKLTITIDSILSLHAYIDASFAVHSDMRGHTGVVITFGCGAIFARSVKQKLASKSSTEAELIALTDALGQVIWTRNLLESLGYKMEPATIFQDNLSTIAMVKNGTPTSHRTRHINIRFFFAKDRVSNGEIKIEHCPTEDMWADLLTKPLQGSLFIKMRDLVLGVPH